MNINLEKNKNELKFLLNLYNKKMTNLLEKMFIKRFCLPIDTNISLYENGIEHIDSCLCGQYNHVSCVLQGKHGLEKR